MTTTSQSASQAAAVTSPVAMSQPSPVQAAVRIPELCNSGQQRTATEV